MPANWKLTPSKCLVSVRRISTILQRSRMWRRSAACRQRAEAVVRDQAEPAALTESLDAVGEEHPVRVAVSRADAAGLSVRVALAVQTPVDLLLPFRLAGPVRWIADHCVELDLVHGPELVDRRVDPDHSLRLGEQGALTFG